VLQGHHHRLSQPRHRSLSRRCPLEMQPLLLSRRSGMKLKTSPSRCAAAITLHSAERGDREGNREIHELSKSWCQAPGMYGGELQSCMCCQADQGMLHPLRKPCCVMVPCFHSCLPCSAMLPTVDLNCICLNGTLRGSLLCTGQSHTTVAELQSGHYPDTLTATGSRHGAGVW